MGAQPAGLREDAAEAADRVALDRDYSRNTGARPMGTAPFSFLGSLVYNSDMLKIIDNDIYRGSSKVGYFFENDIYGAEGKKLGYVEDNDIYDANGRKAGFLDGNYIIASDGGKFRIDENRKRVQGGSISDLMRVAIRLLIGD